MRQASSRSAKGSWRKAACCFRSGCPATVPAKEGPWKFSGNASIYRMGELALAGEPDKPAKVTPVKGAAAGGCKIKIGEKALAHELDQLANQP